MLLQNKKQSKTYNESLQGAVEHGLQRQDDDEGHEADQVQDGREHRRQAGRREQCRQHVAEEDIGILAGGTTIKMK